MASIGDVKKRLPVEFIDGLYSQFSAGTVDKILSGMIGERFTTLRVNTIKYSSQMLMNYFKENNIKFERVLWYKDAFIIKNANERDIEKLDIYKEGLIYLQSLSSMVPPIVLNPHEGEKVLDMTSAPGSKTTQMAAIMNNRGYILANELDRIRVERLKYNINLQGASIVEVRIGRGEKLGENFAEQFDRVLLDAPCSGEGRFLVNDAATYRKWSTREVKRLSSLQKKLIESGYKALKKGGVLVYSTCTLNRNENEEVIEFACASFGFKTEEITLDIKSTGIIDTNDSNNVRNGMLRILPSKEMEGFFVCKLKKL